LFFVFKPSNLFSAAFDYFLSNPLETVDLKQFNEFCGIGVNITPEQIEKAVSLSKHF
jgi:hypothetical protein